MRRPRQPHALPVLALTLCLCGPPEALAADPVAGRPIAELLREATRQGLQIVFSDELVPQSLLAETEPASTGVVARLREILQPHSLALIELSPGAYVVARNQAQSAAAQRSSASGGVPLEEVQVFSSRFTLEAQRAPEAFTLDALDLEQQPALFDDPVRGVRRFPGTAGTALSSRSFVRGGTPEENLLLFDGVTLRDPFHLPALPVDLSVIDPVIIGRVDFHSGVLPLEYGDRSSSVIDMRARPAARRFAGRVAVGTLNASTLAEGRLAGERGDWLAFVRRGTVDLVAGALEPELGRPLLVDALGSIRYRLPNESLLTLAGLGADDDVRLSMRDGTEVTVIESDRGYWWAALEQRLGAANTRTLLTHISSSVDRSGQLDDTAGSFGRVSDWRLLRVLELKQDWSLPLAQADTLRWGVSFRRDYAEYHYRRMTSFPEEIAALFARAPESQYAVAAKTSLRQYVAYAGVGETLGSRWRVEGGARWTLADYSTGQTTRAWDPRIGLMYQHSPDTRLRLSWGRMAQIWGADELPVERNRTAYDRSSSARVSVLAWEHDFAGGASLRAELYDKRVRDPHPRLENMLDPLVLVPELRPDEVFIDPDWSRATGLDVHATASLGERSSGWLSYSWSHARDVIDGREVARAWDQRHALALGVATAWRGWQWSGLLTVRSDWPVTPVPQATSATGIAIGERNSERDGLFMTLDVGAERAFRLSLGSLHVAAELTNALARKNFCCTELEFATRADGTLTAQVKRKYWLPAVPYVSVAWEF